MSEDILILDDVSVNFGGVWASKNVTMKIAQGELVGLIGPNGAGKTTIFNLITSSIQPTSGNIIFKNQSIIGKTPDKISDLGISRTFQNIRLFPQMTVFENVALGFHSVPHYSILEAFIRTPNAIKVEKKMRNDVHALLDLMNISKYVDERAGNLPYGMQRRLEIARAMATSPELILLDEPAAGMNEDECQQLISLIRRIHEDYGYTMIMIEHHMNVVMDLCSKSRIYVLNLGEILAVGSPSQIQNNPLVIKAYLGDKNSATE